MSQPERIIPLDGGVNFRDIGGYPTAAGQHIQYGLVYRSGSLAELTESGVAALSALGVTAVIDMRSDDEVAKSPDRLPIGVTAHHLPIKDPSRIPRLRAVWALFSQRNNLAKLLLDGYTRVMVGANAPTLGRIFKIVAETDGPVVIHCTAGKDRTGVLIALLLLSLGVEQGDVVNDYAISSQFEAEIGRRVAKDIALLKRVDLSEDQIRPILKTDPATLQQTLAYIDDQFGSLSAYLKNECAVDESTLAKLRTKLLKQP